MKRFSVISAAVLGLALAAGNAHATKPGNNGGGNGGCGQGQQTNGCGGNTYNQGGTGGTAYGGHGGTGVGVGVGGAGGQGGKGGEGGSVWGSGNSSNANSNVQGQKQGQQQGQAQSSRNRNDNRSNASATGGSNSNTNANSGNNSDQSVTVQGDNYDAPRIPVATAYAPNIAPTAVCMGSTSAGGQGMTFGVSFGTSWTDDNCMLLEQVRTVATVIGDRDTASEMMCDVPAYKAARERVGKPCGGAQVVASAPAPATAPVADTHQPKYIAQAPIVVSPVVPRIERFRITTDGLQAIN